MWTLLKADSGYQSFANCSALEGFVYLSFYYKRQTLNQDLKMMLGLWKDG